VDDEQVICNGLSKLFENDYIIYKANNGTDALVIINNLMEINVMLCDIMMPGMDGGELIERIRAKNKEVYIIVITATGFPLDVCDVMKKGANDFMRKPLNISQLETMVRNAVKEKR
jgi:DNA-binding NtrC family response regulator